MLRLKQFHRLRPRRAQVHAQLAQDLRANALARQPFPKLVVSGDWRPAFITTMNRLARRLAAQRLLIPGAGHGAQGSGQPFNERLLALMQLARPFDK